MYKSLWTRVLNGPSICRGMGVVPLCFKLFQEMLDCFPQQLHHFIFPHAVQGVFPFTGPGRTGGLLGERKPLGTRRGLGAFGCWEQVPAQLGGGGTTEGARGFIMVLIHISLMISDVDRLFM